MNMIKNLFKRCAPTCIFLAGACSKTPLNIEKENLTPTEWAQRYAARVTSSDASEQAAVREQLPEFDAQRFDWQHFWNLLKGKKTPALDNVLLQRLAGIDCREDSYAAFLEFVLEHGYEIESYWEQAPCSFPKSQKLLEEVVIALDVKRGVQSPAAFTKGLVKTVSSFRNANYRILETKLSPEYWNEIWNYIFPNATHLTELLKLLNSIGLEKVPYSSARIQQAYEKHFNVGSKFEPTELESWTTTFALSPGVKVPKNSFNKADLFMESLFLAWSERWALEKNSDCTESCIKHYLEKLPLLRTIISQFGETLSLRLQLKWNEQYERKLEALLSKFLPASLNVLAQESSVEASWFLMRLNSLYARNEQARAQVSTSWYAEKSSPWKSTLEQVISTRVAIHAASNVEQRILYIQKICDLFEKNKAPEGVLVFGAENEILPGCYRLEASPTNAQLKSVELPFDSVIKSYGANVTINAKNLDASIFDLSAYHKPEKPQPEAPPEGANALVLPLIVGLQMAGPVENAPDEIKFFPIHIVLRKAQSNLKPQRAAAPGFKGGDLSIHIETNGNLKFAPSFVSFGGDGQDAPPPMQGGYGDESYLSISRVLREFVDWMGPAGEGVEFLPQLTHTQLRDLWMRALEKGKLPKLEYSVEQTLAVLQPEQKSKIFRFCELRGYTNTSEATSIEECFLHALIPVAEQTIRQLIDGYQLLSAKEQSQVPAQINGTKAFALAPGSMGGVNLNGAKGERGSLWIEIK